MRRPKPDSEVSIYERLKRIAYGRGWNVKLLASEMGMRYDTVSRVFRGKFSVSFRFLWIFCTVVDCMHLYPELLEQTKKQPRRLIGRKELGK